MLYVVFDRFNESVHTKNFVGNLVVFFCLFFGCKCHIRLLTLVPRASDLYDWHMWTHRAQRMVYTKFQTFLCRKKKKQKIEQILYHF